MNRLAGFDLARFDLAGFDLAGHWRTYLEVFDDSRDQGVAAVRLSPDAFASLPDLIERAVVDAAYTSATAPSTGSWTPVAISIESVDQALRELLLISANAEILAPPELRERLAHTLAVLVRIDIPSAAARGREC